MDVAGYGRLWVTVDGCGWLWVIVGAVGGYGWMCVVLTYLFLVCSNVGIPFSVEMFVSF